jgi:hypothetical protein
MIRRFSMIAIALFLTTIMLMQLSSCKKDTVTITEKACDVRGIYSGTNLSSTGVASTLTYKLQDNNFAVGSVTPPGPAVTFGGYRNTCDSVFLSVYYNYNQNYYLLEGKLLNNKSTITGTFKDLTTGEYGTFTISK